MRNFLLFLAFTILSFTVKADLRYSFREISLREGLSQTSVRDVCRDHRGILWIGTTYGLNRFDGSQMRQYFNQADDSTSLTGNQIHFIQEDALNNLWIGTNKSLVRYNRILDNFEQPRELKNLFFRACVTLPDRIVFFASDRMLSYFYADHSFRTTYYQGNMRQLPLAMKIARLDDRTLLIGTRWKGLFKCDLVTGQVSAEKYHPSLQITDVCISDEGIIWLSSYGDGLFAYDRSGNLLHHFTATNSGLSHNVILDLQFTHDGELWIGTDGNGISRLNKDLAFQHIAYCPEDPYSLPVNAVSKIYQDSQFNLWIGTIRGGLIAVQSNFIRSYTSSYPNSPYGVSERTVSSFYEDHDGQIWIGTDGNGINRFNPKNERFLHYPSTFRRKVISIAPFTKDELLLSYYHGSLTLFNKNNGNVRELPLYKAKGNDDDNRWLGTTLKDVAPGQILLMSEKLYLYSVETKVMRSLSEWTTDSLEAGLRFVAQKGPSVFLFSPSFIYELNLEKKELKECVNLRTQLKSEASAVVLDSSDTFWIGSNDGLWKCKIGDRTIRPENINEFSRISTLCVSPDQSLWIGASSKLYRYQKDTGRFWEYGMSDGVDPNLYISKATCVTSGGEIYLGGVNGFQRIRAELPLLDSVTPLIEPLEFLLNGSLLTGLDFRNGDKVTIPPTNNTVEVRVMVKDRDIFKQKLIRYRLDGLSNEYVTTSDPLLRFTKLPPGNYHLIAQIRGGDGNWTTPSELLQIEVLPFWWESWWFQSILLLFFVVVIILIFRAYKHKQLKIMHDRMIEHEKDMYEQKVRFLINVNHELRTPLTLISAPLSRLLRQTDIPAVELKKTLLGIYKQTKQMRNVIDMVLDIRKMELRQEELHLSDFSLNEFVGEIVEDFRLEFTARGLELCFEPDNAIGIVRLDEDKCHKVLNNLLINALKFSQKTGMVIVRTEKINSGIRVLVDDEGIGLEGVDIQKIFFRFYQTDHNRGGSGIGLSYSKNLIEMQGGSIGCKPNPRHGATFWFDLPESVLEKDGSDLPVSLEALSKDDAITVSEEERFGSDYLILKDYSILVVEDQEELNHYLKEELSHYFKTVYSACNGKEALQIALQYMPDCVVSDVMMPEMNGFEFCKALKTNVEISHIPVLLLTARTDDDSTGYGYRSGADAYLTKPFVLEALLSLLCNIFSSRQKLQERFRASGFTLLPEEISCSSAEEQFLSKLMKIVENELDNPDLDVDMLADRMAVSRSTLYAKMKSISGAGVKDFINEIRIKKAMVLLRETTIPIVEISEKSGFSQQRYFSTVFKQHTGLTPTQYRQQEQK